VADGELKARREERLERALREWVLGVATAGNLVVLKTPPAAAHPVARALDEAALEGVVGTIAGDDTIFLAAATAGIAHRLARRLTSGLLPGRSRRGRG
jgi:transcriptional regulator of arginine metabolism